MIDVFNQLYGNSVKSRLPPLKSSNHFLPLELPPWTQIPLPGCAFVREGALPFLAPATLKQSCLPRLGFSTANTAASTLFLKKFRLSSQKNHFWFL